MRRGRSILLCSGCDEFLPRLGRGEKVYEFTRYLWRVGTRQPRSRVEEIALELGWQSADQLQAPGA